METKIEFNEALAKAVHAYLSEQKNGRYATPMAWGKAILLLILFFFFYGVIMMGEWSWSIHLAIVILWGLISLLIVFNIGHDAVHGSFSKYRWVNVLLGYSFNLVGANAYSWYLKHNKAHHLFTNIDGKDHDIEMDPFLRVSPHKPYRWYFRWQHFYWPFIYALLSLLILFVVDFLIFFQERDSKQRFAQPLKEWVVLVITKFFYLFYIFFVPIYFGGFSWNEVLVAFFAFHLVNGLVIGLVFQPSHYFLETKFYGTSNSDSLPWHQLQLQSTVDMSPGNFFLTHVLGSLNTNVAHHLFPAICHVHYPHLSAIIQDVSMVYRIVYHRKSYYDAIKSHVKLLRKMSRPN